MAGRFRGVTRRGQGWQISFTLSSGERCREIVRFPHTKTGENEAAQVRSAILHEIALGTFDYPKYFPRSPRAIQRARSPGQHVLIRDVLRRYLTEAEAHVAKSTFRDYSSRTCSHLVPAFGHLTLSELTPGHVRKWMESQNLSPKAINNILIPLRHIYREAYLDEVVGSDPMTRVRTLPVRSREPDPFTSDEVTAILGALRKQSVVLWAYFAFAFDSGLRTSELIALTREDVDLERKRIFVNKARVRGELKDPKTSSGRRLVDLRSMAEAAVLDVTSSSGATTELFTDPRTGLAWSNDQAVRKVYWYPTLDSLRIRRRNPYQTRHTFASRLLSAGENPLYVAAQMGHKDWGMIRRVYGRWIE